MATRGYNQHVIAVGIRELKNRLSEYVRQVAAGETVLITDRGTVVAEMRPPLSDSRPESSYPGLELLVRQGRARRGAHNRPDLYEAHPRSDREGLALQLLDERISVG